MLSATSLCPQIVLQEPPYASSLLTFQREWGASAGRTAFSARQPLLKSPLKNRQGAWHRRLWHHRLSRPPLPDSQYDWHPAPRNRQASRFPPNWLVISLCLSGSQRAISPLAPGSFQRCTGMAGPTRHRSSAKTQQLTGPESCTISWRGEWVSGFSWAEKFWVRAHQLDLPVSSRYNFDSRGGYSSAG